ncbi:hypothetical protein CEB3_c19950 [Peptococcaceae bacterium CEB3]|nr:hypothetical protein CEB3_c19950 [Peptococcaceae bacterium CEB3]
MKKICILIICISILTITGYLVYHYSNRKEILNINYTFKGENKFWVAELQVKGIGIVNKNIFGTINFDSNLNKTLIVTYKKDIAQLSSVKYLQISYKEDDYLPKGEKLVEHYDNGSHARKTYVLKSHTTGPAVETGDSIITVTINIDNQIQTIELKTNSAQPYLRF